MEGKTEWLDGREVTPPTLAELITSKLMKGSKELRQNRSHASTSLHRSTEHGGREEGWMEVTPAGRISAAPVS